MFTEKASKRQIKISFLAQTLVLIQENNHNRAFGNIYKSAFDSLTIKCSKLLLSLSWLCFISCVFFYFLFTLLIYNFSVVLFPAGFMLNFLVKSLITFGLSHWQKFIFLPYLFKHISNTIQRRHEEIIITIYVQN